MADKPAPEIKIPSDVEGRLKRGRQAMEQGAGLRNLCLEFTRGNQYLWLGQDGKLYDAQRGAVRSDPNYPNRHRVRQTRNLILPIVGAKVSASTQRIPGYEVLPETFDSEAVAAANLGDKIALAGYDQWRLRRVTQKAVYLALVADESFAFPYWDSNVGPYVGRVGIGDVKVRILSKNQVLSEPGIDFEESPWLAIQYAAPVEELVKDAEYLGGTLVADADAKRITSDKRRSQGKLCLVTEYFERPCPNYPEGRRLILTNARLIFPEETYPLKDGQGAPIDEPCLHRLSYLIDPDADSDSGLVRHLIDPQRTFNDATNKSLEWKNVALNPQVLAPEGSLLKSPTDAPGDILYYRIMPGMPAPEWRPVPPIPQELFSIAENAKLDMGFIADQNQLSSGVVSAVAAQTLTEQDQAAWQRFTADLADWHSRVMRDCLTLVQRYYTEPRLMRYRGTNGWVQIDDFRGADLQGQTNVRVLPGSLEPRTKESITTQVMNYAQMGWVSPEAAMAAIDGGTAAGLVDSYEKDVARANRVIQKIARNVQAFWDEPSRPPFPSEVTDTQGAPVIDPTTRQPITSISGWLPRPSDNARVQRTVIEDFLKGPEYDSWSFEQKDAIGTYYSALLDLEAKDAARQAAMQTQMAQDLGMTNAAKPPLKPMPSLPSTGNGASA